MIPLIAMAAMAAAQQMGKAAKQRSASEVNSETMRYSPWTKLAAQASQAESANQADGPDYAGAAANVFATNMAQEAADAKTLADNNFREEWMNRAYPKAPTAEEQTVSDMNKINSVPTFSSIYNKRSRGV